MNRDSSQNAGTIDIAYVARLARLSLSESEIDVFGRQLGQILDYFEQLRKVNVEGVEPTDHPVSLQNVLRDDDPRADGAMPSSAAEANAPQWRDGTFVVPRIIE